MQQQTIKIIRCWISIPLLLSLCACNSMMSSRMPTSKTTMANIYQQAINGTDSDSGNIEKIRQQVAPIHQTLVPQTQSSIAEQFPLLPNPRLTMYVYGHYATLKSVFTTVVMPNCLTCLVMER